MNYKNEELSLIKECLTLGCSYKEISDFIYEDFGILRTPASIRLKMSKLGFKSINNKKKTIIQFKKELKLVLPNIRIIGIYINASSKIKSKCLECNNIWYPVASHLLKGHGCPNHRKKKHNDFVNNLQLDVSILSNYTGTANNIVAECNRCKKVWDTTPHKLQQGRGCPRCANDRTQSKSVYLIYFRELNLYKVGVTNNILVRLKAFGHKAELIIIIDFSNGLDAYDLETKWLCNLKYLMVNTGLLRSGNTETFKISRV